MLGHDGLGEEMHNRLQELSDAELGQLLVSSAKQLRFGGHDRRELHRRMVQHIISMLAERGRG